MDKVNSRYFYLILLLQFIYCSSLTLKEKRNIKEDISNILDILDHASQRSDEIVEKDNLVSSNAIIINGTKTLINRLDEGFVFCRVDQFQKGQLHNLRVQWRGPSNNPIGEWDIKNRHVFSLGGGYHVPHEYLVFNDFKKRMAGDYSCVLLDRNKKELDRQVITIGMKKRKFPKRYTVSRYFFT